MHAAGDPAGYLDWIVFIQKIREFSKAVKVCVIGCFCTHHIRPKAIAGLILQLQERENSCTLTCQEFLLLDWCYSYD